MSARKRRQKAILRRLWIEELRQKWAEKKAAQ